MRPLRLVANGPPRCRHLPYLAPPPEASTPKEAEAQATRQMRALAARAAEAPVTPAPPEQPASTEAVPGPTVAPRAAAGSLAGSLTQDSNSQDSPAVPNHSDSPAVPTHSDSPAVPKGPPSAHGRCECEPEGSPRHRTLADCMLRRASQPPSVLGCSRPQSARSSPQSDGPRRTGHTCLPGASPSAAANRSRRPRGPSPEGDDRSPSVTPTDACRWCPREHERRPKRQARGLRRRHAAMI